MDAASTFPVYSGCMDAVALLSLLRLRLLMLGTCSLLPLVSGLRESDREGSSTPISQLRDIALHLAVFVVICKVKTRPYYELPLPVTKLCVNHSFSGWMLGSCQLSRAGLHGQSCPDICEAFVQSVMWTSAIATLIAFMPGIFSDSM